MPKYDLKHKIDKGDSPEMEDYFPSISVSTKDVEGLELKIGQKVKFVGVVTGLNEEERKDKKETRYNIDIEQLNKGISEEEYSDLSDEEKDDADAKDLEEKAKKKEE